MAATSAPIILVPGFWLGAWAWDDVAEKLRADGHDVTAITLPGLESKDADRSAIGFADHVDAIQRAVEAADSPVVLVVHSAAGYTAVLNGRFKGGYITRHYGRPARRCHAIQLELSQRTYMNESPPFEFREDLAASLRPVLGVLLETYVRTARGSV